MLEKQKIQDNRALEISLSDLITFLRNYLRLLILAPIFFAILGVCVSFLMTKRYTAQTILLPEYNMGKSNSFFSMAMSMDKNGAEKLVPELYPNILSSTPFGQYLLAQPVMDENGTNYKSLREFFEKTRKPSFMSKLFSFSNSDDTKKKEIVTGPKDILLLPSSELTLIRSASSLIQTTIDNKNGIITIGCEMADPIVATMLVEASKKYLVNYVEEYRTSKTEEQVEFLEERVAEVKSRQQKAEYALQSYRDRNRNSFLNVARIEEQRLQSDFTVAQSVYSDLVTRLEQARIRVKEEKPVFKVLEPAKVPVAKSSPKRIVIGFIAGVVGGFLTLMYIIFFREKYHQRLLY